MIGKVQVQQGLAESIAMMRVSDRNFLIKIERQIDWKPVEKKLQSLYCPDNGRMSHPPIVLFKILLLEQWYGLSDPEAEEAVRDRLSFHKFLGLNFDNEIPDETTICRFRNKLKSNRLYNDLLEAVNAQLETKRLIVKKGTIVDASLIEANCKKPKRGTEASDPDADWTVKNKKPHFGYKAHIGTDAESQMIRAVEMTSASVHDSRLLEHMTIGDEQAIFADKAYANAKQKRQCRAIGLYYGILDKGYRNRPLTSKQKKRNRRLSAIRSAVERVFGTIKRIYGYRRVRYRGLAANNNHLHLLAIALNLKRMVVLTP
ncbi:MAG: IS5/IS1182 family transposase [Syntrophus sp. (in: bacteria)]|nr:IS5/IS1182 family transposase [Syntrophus sp. (in: bacteria)]